MKNTIFLIPIFIFSLIHGLKSQNLTEKFSVNTPTTSYIPKTSEASADLNTGAINVNLPIFDLKSTSLNVPILLKYSGNGVKLDQRHGVTGVNMNLMAGGSITRVVKGLPDETAYVITSEDNCGNKLHFSFPLGYLVTGHNLLYPNASWTDDQTILSSINLPTIPLLGVPNLAKEAKGVALHFDTEPDEFHFNVNGKSGKLVFDKELDRFLCVTDPSILVDVTTTAANFATPNPITYDINDGLVQKSRRFKFKKAAPLAQPSCQDVSVDVFNNNITQIKLVFPDGLICLFGSETEAGGKFNLNNVDAVSDFMAQTINGEIYLNAWHLRKMITANHDDEINFTYTKPAPNAQLAHGIVKSESAGNWVNTSSTVLQGQINYYSILTNITSKYFIANFGYEQSSELGYDKIQIQGDITFSVKFNSNPQIVTGNFVNGLNFLHEVIHNGRLPFIDPDPSKGMLFDLTKTPFVQIDEVVTDLYLRKLNQYRKLNSITTENFGEVFL